MPVENRYLDSFKVKNVTKHPITLGDLVNVTILPGKVLDLLKQPRVTKDKINQSRDLQLAFRVKVLLRIEEPNPLLKTRDERAATISDELSGGTEGTGTGTGADGNVGPTGPVGPVGPTGPMGPVGTVTDASHISVATLNDTTDDGTTKNPFNDSAYATTANLDIIAQDGITFSPSGGSAGKFIIGTAGTYDISCFFVLEVSASTAGTVGAIKVNGSVIYETDPVSDLGVTGVLIHAAVDPAILSVHIIKSLVVNDEIEFEFREESATVLIQGLRGSVANIFQIGVGPQGSPGTQGLMGMTGPSGTVGTTGPAGIDGSAGVTGPIGSDGLIGATGPVGLAGADAIGTKGETGVIGSTGPVGAAGAIGSTGPIGTTGVAGTDGAIGETGPAGPVGADAIGTKGETGVVGATGPAGIGGLSGADGLVGATGPAGVVGSTGPVGTVGSIGATGPIGSAGEIGTKGETGVIGATGSVGPAGIDGATGADGSIGTTGPSGSAGAAGTDGTTGVVGATGLAGTAGIDGVIGATGPAGVVGATGPAGIAGADGVVGATGAVGATGIAGVDGSAGATGPIGPIGIAGTDGSLGSTGPIGATGPTGGVGLQGLQGIQGPEGPISTGAHISVATTLDTVNTLNEINPFYDFDYTGNDAAIDTIINSNITINSYTGEFTANTTGTYVLSFSSILVSTSGAADDGAILRAYIDDYLIFTSGHQSVHGSVDPIEASLEIIQPLTAGSILRFTFQSDLYLGTANKTVMSIAGTTLNIYQLGGSASGGGGGGGSLAFKELNAGVTAGNRNLTDANWNISKSRIDYISIGVTGLLVVFDIAFYEKDTFLPADIRYAASGITGSDGWQDDLEWIYIDEDSTNEIHLKITNVSGVGTYSVHVRGVELL